MIEVSLRAVWSQKENMRAVAVRTPRLVAALTARQNARAQYLVDWCTIAGGGGASTGGVHSVNGPIGQHDAGGPMTGGNSSLTGG